MSEDGQPEPLGCWLEGDGGRERVEARGRARVEGGGGPWRPRVGYLDTGILVSCTPSDIFVAETPPAPSGTVTDDDHVGLDEHLTEAELRAFAEARGIELTDEQVQAFLTVTVTVGDGVDLKESLDSLDETSTP